MGKQQRTLARLVALAAAMHAVDADAEERTVADIVNEARARVEADKRPVSDWSRVQAERRQEEERQKQAEPKRRSWYVGFGGEKPNLSLDELYRVRSQQFHDVPLEYEEPIRDHFNSNDDSLSLLVGRELTDWLDVEVVGHGMQSFYEVRSTTEVAPTTMTPDSPRRTDAKHASSWDERTYSITFLPRWDVNRFVSVYGRLGAGYAQNRLSSELSISASVPDTPDCRADPVTNIEKCTPRFRTETRSLAYIHDIDTGWFPVVGVGIELFEVVRLEYLLRDDVPIGNTHTDIWSNLYLSFRIQKYSWLNQM